MIKEYLRLQMRMLHRQMRAFGLAPIYAYPLAVILFAVFSFLLFAKSVYAPYLYAGMGLLLLPALAKKDRSDFLRTCFPAKDYRRLRSVENLLVVSPFALYLLLEGIYLPVFLLLGGSVIFSLVAVPWSFKPVLPTPFGKKPFEFPMGFRRYFGFVPGLYFVALMGIRVENYSLIVFILVLLFALSSTFYQPVEPKYFVWFYHFREKAFLKDKIRTGIQYSSVLALPVMVAALICFPEHWWISLLASLFGLCFLSAIILSKYAVFPRQAGLPEALWLTAGVLFPPLLIWLLIYFYRKAKKNLKTLLA